MKHPFRHMRLTLKLTIAQCALLLATEGVAAWTDKDYSLFFVMSESYHITNNPTYPQMVGILGAFLRYYRNLINKLSEGEIRTQCEVEWGKLTMGYTDLLEDKPSLKQ